MNKFPELTTQRLRLRQIRISDLPSLLKHLSNKKISGNILNIPHPYSETDAVFRMNFELQAFKNKERYIFTINLHESEDMIGEMGLHLDKVNNKAEIGYWIAEPFWNRGIATESCGAILKFGFEVLNLNKIYATHFIDNIGSGKVLQKNQMILEGKLKDEYKKDEVYKTVMQYRLTKEEYLAND